MDKMKVETFLAYNAENLPEETIPMVASQLAAIDDEHALRIQAMRFMDPTLILVIAIVLGWDRFFIDDIGMGILKILTCYGLGVWWLIDIFTAKRRAREYNYDKLQRAITSTSLY